MTTLILDTSTQKSIVILSEKDKVLIVKKIEGGQLSSKQLFFMIDAAFQECGRGQADLKKVGIGVGPGSFTGTRVGVSAAKGIAFGRPLELIPFSSLSGFISQKEGLFASLIDARLGGAYMMLQRRRGDVIEEVTPPKLYSLEELSGLLTECEEVVGPHFHADFAFLNQRELFPDAAHLAHLVEMKKNREQERVSVLYLRDLYPC